MWHVTLMWMVHTVIINEIWNSCVLLLICNKNVLLLDKINQLSLCYIQFLGYLGRSGLLSLFSDKCHLSNVTCHLDFQRFVSCQLKFWPFVSCQLTPSILLRSTNGQLSRLFRIYVNSIYCWEQDSQWENYKTWENYFKSRGKTRVSTQGRVIQSWIRIAQG